MSKASTLPWWWEKRNSSGDIGKDNSNTTKTEDTTEKTSVDVTESKLPPWLIKRILNRDKKPRKHQPSQPQSDESNDNPNFPPWLKRKCEKDNTTPYNPIDAFSEI